MYAYVGNDPLNATDPSGMRCESNEGTTTCTPEDSEFETVSFPTSEGWEDFDSDDVTFHEYRFEDDAGKGDEAYGDALKSELVKSPTH